MCDGEENRLGNTLLPAWRRGANRQARGGVATAMAFFPDVALAREAKKNLDSRDELNPFLLAAPAARVASIL